MFCFGFLEHLKSISVISLNIDWKFLEKITVFYHQSRTAFMGTGYFLVYFHAIDDISQKTGFAVIVLVFAFCYEYIF